VSPTTGTLDGRPTSPAGIGLFVPKPSRGADYQRCITPDLGVAVRQRLLASIAVGGDCYSLGYSAPGGFGLTTSMRTTGARQVGTRSAGSQRCLRSCMRAVVRSCCCTSCCTELTSKSQGSSVRFRQISLLHWPWPFRSKPSHQAGYPARRRARPNGVARGYGHEARNPPPRRRPPQTVVTSSPRLLSIVSSSH
jgi:hypothetical protein